jgi:alkylhydroperoxidase family enzyme
MPSPTPRIPPLTEPFDVATGEQLVAMMGTGRIEPIALFRLMARNLTMTEASWHLGAYGLGPQLSLSVREREILIDRVCARLGCEYEWGVHVAYFGPRAGLTAPEVTSLTHGDATDPCWTDAREQALITAVDALTDHADLDDDRWTQLAGQFTPDELLDVLVLTGWYHAICFVARATRLPNEPGCPTFASTAD